jgi:alpha-galactosidase
MYSFDGGANEENVLNFIKTVNNHKLPVDYLWIDAGWYESIPPDKWVYTGTWESDKTRFPRGLKPIGQAAHKNDLGFILWFEPERVMKESWLHRNKPEWLLAPDTSLPDDQKDQLDDGFLLNLGNPEALAWAKSNFSKMIKEYTVDIYRNDFNIQPLHHWRNGELPERQGINEIKHVMGLYDLWDTLLKECPGLLIDNCASGGRRIDFETLRRSTPLFRSDECWKPIPEQCMNLGLSLWIPYHGMGSVSLDPYHFWSGTGTNFTVALDIEDHSIWEPATKLLNEFRSIKHLINQDFYPLTAYYCYGFRIYAILCGIWRLACSKVVGVRLRKGEGTGLTVMLYLGWIMEQYPMIADHLIRLSQPSPDKPDFLICRLFPVKIDHPIFLARVH